MKQYFFTLFLLVSFGINAQDRCTELVQTQLVDKIKHLKSTDLLPYYDKISKKWGFFDKNNGEKVTKPFLRYANFFKPNLELRFDFKVNVNQPYVCDGIIMGSKNNYTLQVEEGFPRDAKWRIKPFLNAEIKNMIQAFEVDKKGKLIYVTPKYYNKEWKTTIFQDVFQFKGRYYAIVFTTDNYHIVIDQQGNIIKELKKYNYLSPIYSNSEDVWIVTENSYESIFLNNKKIEFLTNIAIFHDDGFGYRVMETNNGNGLLDLTTMEWKIKPHKDNIFHFLEYTSLEELETTDEQIIPIEMVKKNRKKADIYLVREDNTIQDLNGKIYLPK